MVRIAIGAPAHPVSDRLYGVFFEDLNHGADGGLNANMVNNYSFDGVYVEHNRLRPLGEQRWRSVSDPLRFWRFEGLDVSSLGETIRGSRGQVMHTGDTMTSEDLSLAEWRMVDDADHVGGDRRQPGMTESHGVDAPVHPNSRFARFMVRPRAGTASQGENRAVIENLGYNGGDGHADEPAMAIKSNHSYLFEAYVRSVAYTGFLAIAVVDEGGRPLTDTVHVTVAEGGDWGDARGAKDGGTPHRHDHHASRNGTLVRSEDDAAATAHDPLCRNGWFRVCRVLRALSGVGGGVLGGSDGSSKARYGKLRITVTGDCVFDLDCVSLMDTDYWGAGDPKWRFGKLRRDLVEAIAALRPRFMRFPGGCIVEGITPGNEYNWKDTVGALPARRQQYSMWGFKTPDESSYSQSYQIGFYEYFCLCEDLGAKPLPTLFAGINCQSPGRDPRHVPINSEYFRQTVIGNYLDLIEFANGDPADGGWARVRADMGHPAPFGLDMIGVGNENYGPDYMAKFDAISSAIHALYPDMLCVMSAGLFPFKAPMSRAWDHARNIADSVESRRGQDMPDIARQSAAQQATNQTGRLAAIGSATGDAVLVDEHSYHSPAWFVSQSHRFDDYPRDGAGVYFGEYSANGYFAAQPQDLAHANQWRSALGEAAFLTGCERNGDVVRMTSYAPLLALVDGRQWNHNLIEFNPETVSYTVNAQVERLFSAHVGGTAYVVAVSRSPHDKDASSVDARDGMARRAAGAFGLGLGMMTRGLAQTVGRAGVDAVRKMPNLRGMADGVRDIVDTLTASMAAMARASVLHKAKHVDRDDRGELETISRDLFVSVTGLDDAAGGRRFVKIVNVGDRTIDTRIDFTDTFDGAAWAPVRVRIHMLSGDGRARNQLDWHGGPIQGIDETTRAFTLRAGAARSFALALRPRSVTLVELNV